MTENGVIFDKPIRTWISKSDDSQMHCYLGMKGRVPLGELIAHFAEKYPHVDPMTIELNYATATWSEPPTPEDIAQREANRLRHDERQERWERETYDRLKLKYEDDHDCIAEERRLRERCTFLYGAARAAGCSVEDLISPDIRRNQ